MTERPIMTRTIIMCAPENYSFAISAVKYLLENPEHSSVVSTFGGDVSVSIYARRNKKSITALQVKP